MAAKAKKYLGAITETLLSWQLPNRLFASNPGESRESYTVSSMAMLALYEMKRREAQFTCQAILNQRTTDDPNRGAWRAQIEAPYYHTYAASWAIFGALRVQPTCIETIGSSIDWLIAQQDGKTQGWAHTAKTTPRSFYTAYALNALFEFVECLAISGIANDAGRREKAEKAVQGGVNFLTKNTVRKDIWFWDQSTDGQGLCIATTAIALHVLSKFGRSEAGQSQPWIQPILKQSLAHLLPLFGTDELLRGQAYATHKVDGREVTVKLWPQINENVPSSYWNSYFTPILAVTLMDFGQLSLAGDPALLEKAILTLVTWILDHVYPYKGENKIAIGSSAGSAPTVWSTAQSIVVLRRWLDWL